MSLLTIFVVQEIIEGIRKHGYYWGFGNLEVKRKIQKLVFPGGIILSTQNSQYLTSNVNSLFSLKLDFIRTSEDLKEELPTKNDEESSLCSEDYFMTLMVSA
jgi:hypothetical protein